MISLIKNWKLTLVMLMAAPFMGAVEAFVAKVTNLCTTYITNALEPVVKALPLC